MEGTIVVQKVKEGKGDFGFNATAKNMKTCIKAGVIDPTKVTRIALENAASIAGMLLTTECVVADKPKKEEPHCIRVVLQAWVEWIIKTQTSPKAGL